MTTLSSELFLIFDGRRFIGCATDSYRDLWLRWRRQYERNHSFVQNQSYVTDGSCVNIGLSAFVMILPVGIFRFIISSFLFTFRVRFPFPTSSLPFIAILFEFDGSGRNDLELSNFSEKQNHNYVLGTSRRTRQFYCPFISVQPIAYIFHRVMHTKTQLSTSTSTAIYTFRNSRI